MKIIACLCAACALCAQDMAKPSHDAIASIPNTGKSVILIEPKARAADFAQAFDMLRKDRPTQKIIIRTAAGELNNVTDVSASTGGTLLMIKMLSSQGVRITIVPIEQVMEIGYSP
ncbi:MAG: hypothetical protein KGQ49_03545 [Verrucomicrobia bacterium]|nr:hypothetical protein [Verrucomicrobiota bacterium]MBU6446456.1 hypothetical protein [Verrucomicrobiota bacterium]MDE3047160.1 hypothetical protein [Verrucomicrobiota bacterium]